jgi:flagellar biosynthesis protein FlhG
MQDQADELRSLMLKVTRQHAALHGPPPKLIVLCGGKGGVGVTTLGVNLAVALAHQAARVVLVDADLYRADVATLCGVEDDGNIGDLLAGGRDIHEVLQRGPAGIQIVPGVWAPDKPTELTEAAQRRLITQLCLLGRHAEMALVDTGSGSGESLRRFWQAADEVLLVTTPDDVSVMDAYASIKTRMPAKNRPSLRLIVNRATSPQQAVDVHRRIARSCRRFLEAEVTLLGCVSHDEAFTQAAQSGAPLVIRTPQATAAEEIEQLAGQWLPLLGQRVHPPSAVA